MATDRFSKQEVGEREIWVVVLSDVALLRPSLIVDTMAGNRGRAHLDT